MDPKNMTLGKLVYEFVEAHMIYSEYTAVRSAEGDPKKKKKRIHDLYTELVTRLNLLEITTSRNKLEWGIPDEMQDAKKKKVDYQENLKKKIKEETKKEKKKKGQIDLAKKKLYEC